MTNNNAAQEELAELARAPRFSAIVESAVRLFGSFATLSLPDAIEVCRERLHKKMQEDLAGTSGFERYSCRVLGEIDAERIRQICADHDVNVARLTSSKAFYLQFDPSSVDNAQIDDLLHAESCLNRLYGILKAISLAGQMDATEERCSQIDMTFIRTVADQAPQLMKTSTEKNPWMQVGGASPKRGGEWDVRTRFANVAETLFLPFRLVYDFRCNASNGVFAVELVAPSKSFAPRTYHDAAEGEWREMTPSQAACLVHEYSLRLSVALAAAAFSAGVKVRLVSITAREGTLQGRVAFSARFDRIGFIGALPELSDALSDAPAFVPTAHGKLCPNLQIECDDSGPIPWLRFSSELFAMDERTCDPTTDARLLPTELASAIDAQAVADIAAFAKKDPAMERFNAAMEGVHETPLATVYELEALVDEYDIQNGESHALWFDGYISRLLLPFVDDDIWLFKPQWQEGDGTREEGAASTQDAGGTGNAQDAQDAGGAGDANGARALHAAQAATSPQKLPTSYYLALTSLSELYCDVLGDYEHALAIAYRMVELAPTVTRGYVCAAQALSAMYRFDEAADALEHALTVASDPGAIAYLYYRLAFVYWKLGQEELAIACYIMVPQEYKQISSMATKELNALMRSFGLTEKPGPLDARALLSEAGVPLAPTPSVQQCTTSAAVALVDAGIFNVAAPLLACHGMPLESDVAASVLRSMIG